jgi:hypothetical protein
MDSTLSQPAVRVFTGYNPVFHASLHLFPGIFLAMCAHILLSISYHRVFRRTSKRVRAATINTAMFEDRASQYPPGMQVDLVKRKWENGDRVNSPIGYVAINGLRVGTEAAEGVVKGLGAGRSVGVGMGLL